MQEKIGLFVSGGRFSQVAHSELKLMGFDPVVFSFGAGAGYQNEIVLDFGDIDAFLGYASKNQIRKLVFAGKIEPSKLFNSSMAESGKEFLKNMVLNPENILKNLIDVFTKQGIEIIPLTDVFRNYLAGEKLYTEIEPNTSQWKDINFGWEVAKKIASMGVGQALAIKSGMIVAVEAIEGTDRMIERAGRFCKDFVVIKVIKSFQDIRFDLPTVGPETIRNMVLAGGKIIAVEADKTIMLDQNELIKIANENKLVVVGIRGKEFSGDYQGKS